MQVEILISFYNVFVKLEEVRYTSRFIVIIHYFHIKSFKIVEYDEYDAHFSVFFTLLIQVLKCYNYCIISVRREN